MLNPIEVRAAKFLAMLLPYLEDCFDTESLAWAVDAFNRDYHRAVRFEHGLTRAVFITSDYVVKFDFGRQNDIDRFGGCESECSLYAEAKREGYAYLFAEIHRICVGGKVAYCMPRVRGIGRGEDDVWMYLSEEECDWLNDHGVGDVHYMNYGFRNNRPCIIDYAAQWL